MASEIRPKVLLAPFVPLAIILLLLIVAALRSPSSGAGVANAAQSGALSSSADIPVAPDYAFNSADGNVSPLTVPEALRVAGEVAPPGFVGSKPVVRFLMVRDRRGDFEPQIVILSTDALAIVPFGDGADDASLAPVVATYSWVFLTPTGEFLGATRRAYTSEPPTVPEQ